mmetsp:Transcript_27334/g.50109  ORF Transcript_27334/g.50109 Transcript_27334/m.50109 type:complete len:88 (-) Transcript_27334:359-622(-)
MMVTPCSFSAATTSHISLRSSTSTPAVGSSKNRTRGSWLSALAINTLRFIPPDSSITRESFLSQRESCLRISSIFAGLAFLPNSPRE